MEEEMKEGKAYGDRRELDTSLGVWFPPR